MNKRFTKTCSISYRIALSSFNSGLILFVVCGRPRGHFYVRPWLKLKFCRFAHRLRTSDGHIFFSSKYFFIWFSVLYSAWKAAFFLRMTQHYLMKNTISLLTEFSFMIFFRLERMVVGTAEFHGSCRNAAFENFRLSFCKIGSSCDKRSNFKCKSCHLVL